MLSQLAGAPENGGFDLVKSRGNITQEKKELVLGRCYRGYSLDFVYTGPRCYDIQA